MRNIRKRLATMVAAGVGASLAATSWAQVLQLPTYSYFSTDSSVLAPDRGTTSLGGVSRSSSGSNQFGPPFLPPSRSQGGSQGASVSSVTATIHDLDEMDRAVLARAASQRRTAGLARAGAAGLARPAGAPGAADSEEPAPIASVAELAAHRASAAVRGAQEIDQLEGKAREAIGHGKPGVAKVYLQMAARRASGDRKAKLLAMLESLEPRPAARAPVAAAR